MLVSLDMFEYSVVLLTRVKSCVTLCGIQTIPWKHSMVCGVLQYIPQHTHTLTYTNTHMQTVENTLGNDTDNCALFNNDAAFSYYYVYKNNHKIRKC